MRRHSLALPAALVLFVATPTQAADGVVEINQSCAVGPGCFSGDAGVLPVTIDGSAGRSYRLTSDLVVSDASTDAIVISTDDVSVDLNGFRIQGPNVCSGTPTTCTLSGVGDGVFSDRDGVEVFHGSVVGMGGLGVALRTRGVIRDVRASQNGSTGLYAGDGGLVSGSTASRNGAWGMYIEGSGATVTGSSATQNGSDGITLDEGSVIGSSAARNGGYGIIVYDSSAVSSCSSHRNLGGGIRVGGGTVSSSSSFLNGGDGFQTGAGSLVIGSTARNNIGAGLRLGDDSAYRENAITGNTGGTVVINGAGAFANLGDNFCTDNANATVLCP